jgi:hypothetical protein
MNDADRERLEWYGEIFANACEIANSLDEAMLAANHAFSLCPTRTHRDVLRIFNRGMKKLQRRTARSVPLSLTSSYEDFTRRQKPHA